MPTFLSHDVDYYDALRTQLGDLQGADTLIHELAQNAHDSYRDAQRTVRASRLIFDIKDDGLRVWNDGIFQSCGDIESTECLWEAGGASKERCDFHRFRKVAHGNKANAEGVLGAFGVGFISVYQVTDRPEFWSNGFHWTLDPALDASKRIASEEDHDNRAGTEFWLPWAPFAGSVLGEKLRRTPVEPAEHIRLLQERGPQVAAQAIMFLENIESIEVLRNGKPMSRITKAVCGDDLVIDKDGVTTTWLLVRGGFEEYKLSEIASNSDLFSRRSSAVNIAIPEEPQGLEGLLFCGLPTRQPTQLPFHVNAHFFPSSDRKRIDLEGEDVRVRWNIAAVTAAAEALARDLPLIRDRLGHKALWALMTALLATGRQQWLQELFWSRMVVQARQESVLYGSRGTWSLPADAFYLAKPEEEANLGALNALGITVAHPELRPHRGVLNALGVRQFGLEDLCDAVARATGTQRTAAADAHQVLSEPQLRAQLGEELEIVYQSAAKDKQASARETLSSRAVCLTAAGEFACPQAVIATQSDTDSHALASIGLASRVAAEPELSTPFLRGLSPTDPLLQAARYVAVLASQNRDGFAKRLPLLFEWLFENHLGDLRQSPETRDTLARARIWPGSGGLYALSDLVVPGGFADALGLASTLDTAFAPGMADLAVALGASQLDVVTYACVWVPRLFARPEPPAPDALTELLKELAGHLDRLSDSFEARQALSRLPLAFCSDGELHPPGEVVFESVQSRNILGPGAPLCQPPDPGIRALLTWLGASEQVTETVLLKRINSIIADAPTQQSRGTMQHMVVALAALQTLEGLSEAAVSQLERLTWLPAVGDCSWHRPDKLLTGFLKKALFGENGLQLDLPLARQREAAGLLDALGMKQEPDPDVAVDYLQQLLGRGEEPTRALLEFLDRKADWRAIQRLRSLPLFVAQDGTRYESARAFSEQHPFGRWAITLSGDWRALPALLKALGVSEAPDCRDAARILAHIEIVEGQYHHVLRGEDLAVVRNCWALIGSTDDDVALDEALEILELRRVAPDARGMLVPPSDLIFDDQPEVGRYVAGALGPNLVSRHGESWRGMSLAGVSNLSDVVSITVNEPENRKDQTEGVRSMLSSRRPALERALAQDNSLENPADLIDSWLGLAFATTSKLSATIRISSMQMDVPVERVRDALLDRQNSTLYIIEANRFPAAAVARELLTGAQVESGHLPLLVTALEQVLLADDEESAQTALDDRGFAKFDPDEQTMAAGEPSRPVPRAGKADESRTRVKSDDEEISATPDQEDALGPDVNQGFHDSGKTRSPKLPPLKPRRSDQQFHSYISNASERKSSEESKAAHERHLEICRAGVDRVLAYERKMGRMAEEMPHSNKGYDVVSEDDFGHVRFIEVKSTVELWGARGVGITPAQHDFARQSPEDWWLYVVEAAESDADYAIYCINDFIEMTSRYRFDDGWRAAAKERSGNWKSNEASIKASKALGMVQLDTE